MSVCERRHTHPPSSWTFLKGLQRLVLRQIQPTSPTFDGKINSLQISSEIGETALRIHYCVSTAAWNYYWDYLTACAATHTRRGRERVRRVFRSVAPIFKTWHRIEDLRIWRVRVTVSKTASQPVDQWKTPVGAGGVCVFVCICVVLSGAFAWSTSQHGDKTLARPTYLWGSARWKQIARGRNHTMVTFHVVRVAKATVVSQSAGSGLPVSRFNFLYFRRRCWGDLCRPQCVYTPVGACCWNLFIRNKGWVLRQKLEIWGKKHASIWAQETHQYETEQRTAPGDGKAALLNGLQGTHPYLMFRVFTRGFVAVWLCVPTRPPRAQTSAVWWSNSPLHWRLE